MEDKTDLGIISEMFARSKEDFSRGKDVLESNINITRKDIRFIFDAEGTFQYVLNERAKQGV